MFIKLFINIIFYYNILFNNIIKINVNDYKLII